MFCFMDCLNVYLIIFDYKTSNLVFLKVSGEGPLLNISKVLQTDTFVQSIQMNS